MREKTVTFLVRSARNNRLTVPGDTTVNKLRSALERGGYDVDDASIRIIRDGRSFIGHVKNVLLHDNDLVIFDTKDVQVRVSRDIKQTPATTGCSPECCSDRAEQMKKNILAALKDFERAVVNA